MFYYLVWYLLAILRDDGVESALIKFADDTKVGVDVSTSEDGIRIQNDLKTLEKYSQTSKTEFSNNVYKALHEKKKRWKIKRTNIKCRITDKVEGLQKKKCESYSRTQSKYKQSR